MVAKFRPSDIAKITIVPIRPTRHGLIGDRLSTGPPNGPRFSAPYSTNGLVNHRTTPPFFGYHARLFVILL